MIVRSRVEIHRQGIERSSTQPADPARPRSFHIQPHRRSITICSARPCRDPGLIRSFRSLPTNPPDRSQVGFERGTRFNRTHAALRPDPGTTSSPSKTSQLDPWSIVHGDYRLGIGVDLDALSLTPAMADPPGQHPLVRPDRPDPSAGRPQWTLPTSRIDETPVPDQFTAPEST